MILLLINRKDDKEQLFFCVLDLDLMKEKFSKLLLGEDMSGGGKGVSSALALSNAITNLAGKHKIHAGSHNNTTKSQKMFYC